MQNLVLYRKYRPQSFKEFIGQEHIVKTLTNSILNKRISHAYLFSGPRGTGKTTLARLFAKAINCENPNGFEPCNKCPSCEEINAGRSMDLVEIDAASHTGIEDVRDLKQGIRFVPSKLKYKVFIIDECHQLSSKAANALLKTLEEPPSHAVFILATTEIQKIIPTILSRCQRFDFRKLRINEIVQKLKIDCKKEKAKVQKSALELIAQNSEGSIRDAESLLDKALTFSANKTIETEEVKQILGLVETKILSELTNLITKKKKKESVEFFQEKIDQGLGLKSFSKAIINYLHQGLLIKITGENSSIINALTKQNISNLNEQMKNLTENEIIKMIKIFSDADNKMKNAPIPQLVLEIAIIESCEI